MEEGLGLFAGLSVSDFTDDDREKKKKTPINSTEMIKLKILEPFWFNKEMEHPLVWGSDGFKGSSSTIRGKRALVGFLYAKQEYGVIIDECKAIIDAGRSFMSSLVLDQFTDILGRSLMKTNRWEEALLVFEEMKDKRLKLPIRLCLAKCYWKQERFSEAFQLYVACIGDEKKNPYIWKSIGECAWKANRLEIVLLAFGCVLKLTSDALAEKQKQRFSLAGWVRCKSAVESFLNLLKDRVDLSDFEMNILGKVTGADWIGTVKMSQFEDDTGLLETMKDILSKELSDELVEEDLMDPYHL